MKQNNRTYAIRAIKYILKSKLKYEVLARYVKNYNKKVYAKGRHKYPGHDDYKLRYKLSNELLDYPVWIEGKVNYNFKLHRSWNNNVFSRHYCDVDFHNDNSLTALHILYLRLRESTKQHTGNDYVWVKNNYWTCKKVAEQLSQIYEIQISETLWVESEGQVARDG